MRLDEHDELAAFDVERCAAVGTQTIVVELIDRGASFGNERWTVSACDELNDRTTGLVLGATARQAIGTVPSRELA